MACQTLLDTKGFLGNDGGNGLTHLDFIVLSQPDDRNSKIILADLWAKLKRNLPDSIKASSRILKDRGKLRNITGTLEKSLKI